MTNTLLGGNTTHVVDSVAQLKTLDVEPGNYVQTRSYTADYLTSGDNVFGGALYEITTVTAYRALIGKPSWTPDGVLDFTLNNSNIAVNVSANGFGSVAQMKLACLEAGTIVNTVSYYDATSSTAAKGGAQYQIVTPAQFTTITGISTADGYNDHILANDNVAMLVDVEAYASGLLVDGTTDDTLALRAFIARCVAVDENCVLPSGEILITDTITVPEFGHIIGQGQCQLATSFSTAPKSTTILFQPTSAKTCMSFTGNDHAGFRFHQSLSGIHFIGNSANASGNSTYALYLDQVIYCNFYNISIEGFRTPVYCLDTINNRFENLYMKGEIACVEYAGISTTDVWDQCSFQQTPTGVIINSTTIGIRFESCLAEQIDEYGFDIHATAQQIVVKGLYSEDVPFVAANADAAVFRVGRTGTANKNGIQLQVSDSTLRGKNASTVGSAFFITESDGVFISNTFIRKFVNAIECTNATRTASISTNNITWTSVTNTITDFTKVFGSYYTTQISDTNIHQSAEYRTIRGNAYRAPTGLDTVVISSATTSYLLGGTFLNPTTDNAATLGTGANRWSVVYAGTGTINTSDARLKTFLTIEESEKAAALEIKSNIRKYKFNDAIEKKGLDGARIHYGVSAQEVGAILESHGLDPSEYAFFCYDEWEAQEEVLDDEGLILQEAKQDGNRYGIRYDELLAFILSAI